LEAAPLGRVFRSLTRVVRPRPQDLAIDETHPMNAVLYRGQVTKVPKWHRKMGSGV